MAKYLRTENKKPKKHFPVIAIFLVVILALAAVFLLPRDTSGDVSDPVAGTGQQALPTREQPAISTEPVETQQLTVDFPLTLEDGKLEVENIFQYEGINPDCDFEDGTDVASIMLKNLSEDYLAEAKITLELVDGTALNFVVNDLPAGKTVMAFSVDNTSVEADVECVSAVCTASWDSELVALPDAVSVSVDGVAITVTNNTDQDISELVIYCRCPLDEDYFGGLAYPYTINDLSANGSATVEAWDCILGMAEVVRIAVNQE